MTISRNKFFWGTLAYMGAAAAFAAVFFLVPVGAAQRNGASLALALACLNAVLGFASLHWAMRRSDKIFFGAFFGGILWKFLVLGGTFFYLLGHPGLHAAATLLTLAVMTLLYDLIEILCLERTPARHGF